MLNVEIRPYRNADHADVARVWYESTLSSVAVGEARPNLRDELFERVPREIDTGWSLFVATDNECVVGMLALKLEAQHLHELFVDPSFQNRGIGKALLDFTKSKMPDGFWLTTMTINRGARRFYEREGLVHKHDRPHPSHPNYMHSTYEWTPSPVHAPQ